MRDTAVNDLIFCLCNVQGFTKPKDNMQMWCGGRDEMEIETNNEDHDDDAYYDKMLVVALNHFFQKMQSLGPHKDNVFWRGHEMGRQAAISETKSRRRGNAISCATIKAALNITKYGKKQTVWAICHKEQFWGIVEG
uniref:Uncharacterized protein n=1 Tax=Romanomermis culicivorax TaxID=13658 RepID=A0A915JXJ8_ROMCU